MSARSAEAREARFLVECIVMSELIAPDFELQRLYCTDNPMFAMARSLGLQVVNSNTNLKRFALNQASN